MSLASPAVVKYSLISCWWTGAGSPQVIHDAYAAYPSGDFPSFWRVMLDAVGKYRGSGFTFGELGWDCMDGQEQSAFFDYAYDLGVKVTNDEQNRRVIVFSPKGEGSSASNDTT